MAKSRVRDNYLTVNGCKRQLQCEQLFWVFSFVGLLALYSVFVAPCVLLDIHISFTVTSVIVFLLCLPIFYDYCKLTCTDPVDPNIISEQSYHSRESKVCSICQLSVKLQTQHCLSCRRCTDRMDHHSQLVNNCVSLNQSSNYLRLNICFCLVNAIFTAQSLGLFWLSQIDDEIQSRLLNKWAVVFLAIFSLINFLFGFSNSAFSCYLRIKDTTRIGYRFRQTDSNNSDCGSDRLQQQQTDEHEQYIQHQ